MEDDIQLNVVIPMAGLGSRFTEYGFTENKYLLPIDDKLTKMIEKAILTLNIHIPNTCFIFILREENNIIQHELRNYLQELCHSHKYHCKIISVPSLTEGPASTVYAAKTLIQNDIPLIISNSDQILDWNFDLFYQTCSLYDGCVLTYKPTYELIMGNKDKHSFVRFDENHIPVEFVEKTIISDEALVGVHYYKKGSYFVETYEYLYEKNIRAPNGEFYLSYTYEAMIQLGGYTIGTHLLDNTTEIFYPVGEPMDYFEYYHLFSGIKIYNDITKFPNTSYFQLVEIKKGQPFILQNEMIIVINGKIKGEKVFLSGKYTLLELQEDTTILRVFHIYSDTFQSIDINNYTRGWLIGDFQPSIQRTNDFEIGLLQHAKNEKWGFHYHKKSIEINVLAKGSMIVNGKRINVNDIFIFNQNIISCPLFLEDCEIICIKLPSSPNDKYII
jgi:dTDP-glucose pyrophosphorylase